MKLIIIVILLLLFVSLPADDLNEMNESSSWRLERTNFHYENDLVFNSDNEYTSGIKVSNIYSISNIESEWLKFPFIYDDKNTHLVSIGIAQQIFTPTDTVSSGVVVNDRPYAGWLYLDIGLHESSLRTLSSLTLQVGVVGKSSLGEVSQKEVHKLRGIDVPQGWDNQLKDELGINIMYQHKWRFVPAPIAGFQSNFIPFVEGSLGNVKTYARVGALMRFGINPLKDFGSSSINVGGENGIPMSTGNLCAEEKPWSFTLNLSVAGTAVARDIFLDGNTFAHSHSVEKKNFVAYVAYGFTVRYKHLLMDWLLTTSSKEFEQARNHHEYGGFLISYLY